MWTKFAAPCAYSYAENHRAHAWKLNNRDRGIAVIEDCVIDAYGWVIYAMWLRTSPDSAAFSSWEWTYYMALIDEGALIQTYTLTDEEFQGPPGLPNAWWVPF